MAVEAVFEPAAPDDDLVRAALPPAAGRVTARTLRFAEIRVGDRLPSLEVPITPTLIVAGAIASRDYQEVRHDRDLAVARGSKDIFMNILTTNGFVGRFVTDWAGPDALLKWVDIRSIADRRHAATNPAAWFYGKPITLEEHQASRWIVEPCACSTAARRATARWPWW